MTYLPAVLGAVMSAFLLGYVVFRVKRRAAGQQPTVLRRAPTLLVSRDLMDYVYWLVTPVERALVASGTSPHALTTLGLVLSVAAGLAAGYGSFTTAGVLYLTGGILDVLDGRVARRAGRSTKAGALFDSVCDRWGEFAILAGLAFALRQHNTGLASVLLATAGSQMVSYTRARAEGLGVSLSVGLMQRSERIVLVGLGLLAAGAFATVGREILTATLLVVGGMSSITALRRLYLGSAALAKQESDPVAPTAQKVTKRNS
jgi:CDP-diacylglycerol--glycerol-3-phosphate 3-phosphatidyltransferase